MQQPSTDLGKVKTSLNITLISHGVKGGHEWPKADLYIDCRGVIDPSQAANLPGSGDDPSVQEFVKVNTNISPYFEITVENFCRLTSRRGAGKEFDKPFTICCMCAHGIHRSRAMKNILANMLKGVGYTKVEVK